MAVVSLGWRCPPGPQWGSVLSGIWGGVSLSPSVPLIPPRVSARGGSGPAPCLHCSQWRSSAPGAVHHVSPRRCRQSSPPHPVCPPHVPLYPPPTSRPPPNTAHPAQCHSADSDIVTYSYTREQKMLYTTPPHPPDPPHPERRGGSAQPHGAAGRHGGGARYIHGVLGGGRGTPRPRTPPPPPPGPAGEAGGSRWFFPPTPLGTAVPWGGGWLYILMLNKGIN